MSNRPNQLIEAEELARLLEAGEDVRVLDVRWQLGNPHTHDEYLAGHVPGALFVDLETELSDPPTPRLGRHPLPSAERLQAAVTRWGVDDGTEIVVLDAVGATAAARAWWVLRDAGLERVRVLDGGFPAWQAAGLPVEAGEVDPPGGGTARVRPGALARVSLDEVAGVPRSGVLLDVRAAERYRGEVEPIDPRAGHVPGARSAPTGENLDERGRFRSAAELRERFESLGVEPDRPIVAYCGSGVTAAHTVLALELAGFDPALYPGSWSQWSNRDELPVAIGDAPGDPA